MNYLNLGRKARLGNKIRQKKAEVDGKYAIGQVYYEKILSKACLTKEELDFHNANFLIGIYSIFEFFLSDIALEILICFPEQLEEKNLKVNALVGNLIIEDTVNEIASKKVRAMLYGKFHDFIDKFKKLVTIKNLDAELINKINEIKCTRDIYVHNNGRINKEYTEKAGDEYARQKENNELLSLDQAYLESSIQLITKFIGSIYANGLCKFEKYTEAYVFKQLWEESHIGKVFPFDQAWGIREGEFVDYNVVH